MRKAFLAAGLWLWVLYGAGPLGAQTSLGTSAVGGTVRDATGSAVPAATVELVDTQRGVARKTVTNAAGDYVFNGVAAGLYTLRVARQGFDTSTVSNFQVVVNQRATVDVTMQVGAVTQSVLVNAEGEAPLLETASNALGTVIDQTRVSMLPLNGRDFLQLALLAGGTAQPGGLSDVVAGQQGHSDRSVILSGNSPFQTSYLIDGIATRGSRLGESALNLSVSAIDQFKIQIGFFMPDQGPNPGIVNLITKGGTNEYHGEAFEFLRNTRLDSRNFFAPAPEQLQRNQFGFALGGPVLIPGLFNGKNKLWFHTDYEGTRQVQKFSTAAFTPTAAMFGGDFGEVPQAIYNPLTFDPGTGTRQPFPNNRVPASLINPVASKLLSYYLPGSSFARRPSNLFGNPVNTLNDDQFTIRADAALSERQSLFAAVTWENSPAIQASLIPLAGAYFPFDTQLAVVQHTITAGPHLVNIARIGFSRSSVNNEGQAEAGPPLAPQLGITGTLDPRGISGIGIQGFTGFGRSGGPLGNTDNNYQVDEGLNYNHASHSFSFGAGIRYHRTKQQNANANAVGTLSFQTVFTAQLAPAAGGRLAPAANTGSAFADFLLGMPTSGQVLGLQPIHYYYTEYFPYFQDSWRVTPSLTLNYGLSWYYGQIPNPQGPDRQIIHSFDFQTGLLRYAALNQMDPQIFRPDRNNFTPRFGLAWQPKFLKDTVIRAGAGVYYGQLGLIEAQFGAVGPPFQNSVSIVNNQFNSLPTYVLGQNVFPVVPLPPLTPDFAANLPPGFAPFAANPDSRTPYVTQWNFSVQHTIGRDDLIQADYLGSSAHKQQDRYDIDQCLATAGLGCDPARRPYPRYTSLLFSNNSGNMSYEALMLKYQHQFAHGLTLLANYTFSKTLSDTWEVASSTINQIAGCRACDKGPVSYNVPHRVVISTVYELPFGRGRHFASTLPKAADLLLGGWNLNGILTFSTGSSFSITSPNRTGSNFSYVRANRLCNGSDSQLSGSVRANGGYFFNTACFAAPAAGFFGNSGRGILLGPGINNWDGAVSKNFTLHEASRIEFRSEFFNMWNHAQFNLPSADTGSLNFGQITSARPPRLIQLALKLIW